MQPLRTVSSPCVCTCLRHLLITGIRGSVQNRHKVRRSLGVSAAQEPPSTWNAAHQIITNLRLHSSGLEAYGFHRKRIITTRTTAWPWNVLLGTHFSTTVIRSFHQSHADFEPIGKGSLPRFMGLLGTIRSCQGLISDEAVSN